MFAPSVVLPTTGLMSWFASPVRKLRTIASFFARPASRGNVPPNVTPGSVVSSSPDRSRRQDLAVDAEDSFPVVCPYCGEQVEIYLEPDVKGTFVQDCEVCCNPWRVTVSTDGDDRSVDVGRADGSE